MIFPLQFNRWKHYLFSKNIRLSLQVPKVTNVMWLLLQTLVYAVSDLILHFSIILADLLYYVYFGPYYLLTRFVFSLILYLFLSFFLSVFHYFSLFLYLLNFCFPFSSLSLIFFFFKFLLCLSLSLC